MNLPCSRFAFQSWCSSFGSLSFVFDMFSYPMNTPLDSSQMEWLKAIHAVFTHALPLRFIYELPGSPPLPYLATLSRVPPTFKSWTRSLCSLLGEYNSWQSLRCENLVKIQSSTFLPIYLFLLLIPSNVLN